MPTLKNIVIHTFMPLVFGVLVYAIFRNNTIFSTPLLYINSGSFIIKIIKNHLSDCLWAYSFCSSLLLLTSLSIKMVFFISIGFVWLMEYYTSKYFSQTFDWLDVIFMSFFITLSACIIKKK